MTAPKEANYIYFNFPTTFTVKLNNEEITLSEPSENKGDSDGQDKNQGDFDDQSDLLNQIGLVILSLLAIILIIMIVI